MASGDPCPGCPSNIPERKVAPTHSERPALVVVGVAPDRETDRAMAVELAALDLAPEQVAFLNLARCWPTGGDFDSKEWKASEKNCMVHFSRDLSQYDSKVPLLLLGAAPLKALTADSKARLTSVRGLWIKTADGRDAFASRHPRQFLGAQDPAVRGDLLEQFRVDMRRMAERVHGTEEQSPIRLVVATTLDQVADIAGRLARHRRMWAFDLETFDAGAFPSRKEVAVDPCHPDFRVRGMAVAWTPTQGAWLELAPLATQRAKVCALLTPAMETEADKTAFNGSIDEEGLIVPGWAERVRRTRDAMLALNALSDGRHESLRLEKAVVDVLGHRQYWAGGIDKGRMRDLSLEEVARGGVGDACATLELELLLEQRMERGEYM